MREEPIYTSQITTKMWPAPNVFGGGYPPQTRGPGGGYLGFLGFPPGNTLRPTRGVLSY